LLVYRNWVFWMPLCLLLSGYAFEVLCYNDLSFHFAPQAGGADRSLSVITHFEEKLVTAIAANFDHFSKIVKWRG